MNDVNPMKTHFFRYGFIAILAMTLLTGCDKPEQEVLIEKDDDRYQASLNEEAAYLQDVSFLEINQGNVAAIWLAMQANKQTPDYVPSVEEVKEYEALIMPITKSCWKIAEWSLTERYKREMLWRKVQLKNLSQTY